MVESESTRDASSSTATRAGCRYETGLPCTMALPPGTRDSSGAPREPAAREETGSHDAGGDAEAQCATVCDRARTGLCAHSNTQLCATRTDRGPKLSAREPARNRVAILRNEPNPFSELAILHAD